MAGEQPLAAGGKLRLKRRRPPGRGEAARPTPAAAADGRLQTEGSGPGWFEAPDLSEADRTWLALLQTADSQLNRSNLDKVVKLPEFLTKFQWEPFPLYQRDIKTIDHSVRQNSGSPTTSVVEQEMYEDEQSKIMSPVPKQKPLTAYEYTAEGSKMRHSTGYSSKDCGKKIKNSPRTPRKNSAKSFSPATVQQKLGLRELWKKASTQSKPKSTIESEEEGASSGTLTQNKTTLLPSQGSAVHSGISSLQLKPGRQNEDISTLDCCPMCQFHFTGTLSQLDRDSHLAKCLSESTEDMIW
uniref:Uncharacterized protein n=1 Tax=Sphaerodactylus townsendi TaxID=933632 RepID=A0ACB8EE87_9SAUR